MKKKYILDTSTLIHDPYAYKNFPDSDVIIPIVVLNELDNLKKGPSSAGRNARVAIRGLDAACSNGDISTGILMHNNSILSIDANYLDMSDPKYTGFGDPSYGDTRILVCAYVHHLENSETILVSNDINLRVKAQARGISAEHYDGENGYFNDLYSGVQVVEDEVAGNALSKLSSINPEDYELDMYDNECVIFENENGEDIALGRKTDIDKIKLVKKVYPWNLSSRNPEQTFAIDMIMDKNVDLVTLVGAAGTGKSLVALASALELVVNRREYEKLVIYRPIQPVGNDIGFTPGTIEEKLAPWFQAILDSFEVLFSNNSSVSGKNVGEWKRNLEMYQKKGRIEMAAITYIRGRSIPNSIILIDEAQNLSKDEIKTILTRAGENTKIILTGDLEQIDASSLDATSNGLTYVIEKFKESDIAGHVTFTQGERSRLASESARLL
jgi:PhoH-like ATPase